jgi:predicted dienelactone hydrolase
LPSPRRRCRFGALLASLLLASAAATAPLRAAELLEVRLEDLVLPVNLRQLEAWARQRQDRPASEPPPGADLLVWLSLPGATTQRDLRFLLTMPLLRERSFGRQLLDSWAGRLVLEEVGQLLTHPDGRRSTDLLDTTLRRLMEQQREVSAIDLLRELPAERLSLQLDAMLLTASQWRQQLSFQIRALRELQTLGLPVEPGNRFRVDPVGPTELSLAARRPVAWRAAAVPEQKLALKVPHRPLPLPLVLWPAVAPTAGPAAAGATAANAATPPRPWVLLLHGLGGEIDQLSWLGRGLAQRGWSVLALQHPGSDGAALREALQGQRPPPGGESLALRLADIDAVLQAQRRGRLPVRGAGVVLLGHSLGAVTALLAAGLMPEAGLEQRCRQALERLPFTNPSRLLQCQLPPALRHRALTGPGELQAVVGLNPFGSLLWPRRGISGLAVPVLLGGGSLDLVTPLLEEQLGLFLPAATPRNRLVVVQGGSHFSPIHVADGNTALFRLGDELVGVAPATVQELLLQLTGDFLGGLTAPQPQRLSREGVTAFVLDPAFARRWRRALQP